MILSWILSTCWPSLHLPLVCTVHVYSTDAYALFLVNAPPPPAVISMLNKLAAKKHRSLFYAGTKESMVPLFEEDLSGKPQKDK